MNVDRIGISMRVMVEIPGGDSHEIELHDIHTNSSDTTPTYRDLLAMIDLSPQEVSVLVEGIPVPENQPITAESVTVLRLVQGG